MASSNKRKTTAAKRDRERGLAERRLEKQARKALRKQAAAAESQRPASPVPPEAGAPHDHGA